MRQRVRWRNRKSAEVSGIEFLHGQGRAEAANSAKSTAKFKERVRETTLVSRGRSMKQTIEELSRYMRGWIAYFGFCQTP